MANEVVLYVVPDCPLCAGVKETLSQLNTAFVERDVTDDFGALRRMFKLTRQKLVPVVELEGKAIVRPTTLELRGLLGLD